MSGREETAAEELPQPSLVPKRAEADVTSGEPHPQDIASPVPRRCSEPVAPSGQLMGTCRGG